MSKANYTRIPVTEMVYTLPTGEWQMRLVPDDDHSGLPVLSLTYTPGQLIKSVGYLRHENMNGYHIYGRPLTYRHVLVDDLDQDALDRLSLDNLRPAVRVRTSKGNYQAWITLSNEEIEPTIAKAAARILAERYDGDFGSADAYHVGRFPGFTNRKDIYWGGNNYPFTGLHGKVLRGVATGASELLEEAEMYAASIPSSSPYSLRGCGPTSSITTNIDIDPSRSPMTETEANEIYPAEMKCQAERKQLELLIRDRSNMDYYIVNGLYLKYGYDPDDLAALLLYASEKAAERGMDYVIRTVSRVCQNGHTEAHLI
jgi:hypothetical protein